MINVLVLAIPNYELLFVMYTDASALGLSAVLMKQDAPGKHSAATYMCRILNHAKSNDTLAHQETLAVVSALNHFRDIILGYPITLFTGLAAVTELFKSRNLTGRFV